MKRLFVWLASVSICAAQAVSIGPFATEDWVEERLKEAESVTNGLASVSYVDDLVSDVEDKIPDVSGLATKEYVDAVSNAIPDSSTFATVEYVNTTSNNLALLMDDLVSEEELGSSVSNIVPAWALVPVPPVTVEVDPTFTNWLATTNVVIDDNFGTFVSNVVPSWALVPVPPVTVEVDPTFTNWLATTNSATVQYVDGHQWDWDTQITNAPAFPIYDETTLHMGDYEYDLAGFATVSDATLTEIAEFSEWIVKANGEVTTEAKVRFTTDPMGRTFYQFYPPSAPDVSLAEFYYPTDTQITIVAQGRDFAPGVEFSATRTKLSSSYQLGSQTNKLLQPAGDYVDKSYVDSHQWDWDTQVTNAPSFVESEVDPVFTNWLATTNVALESIQIPQDHTAFTLRYVPNGPRTFYYDGTNSSVGLFMVDNKGDPYISACNGQYASLIDPVFFDNKREAFEDIYGNNVRVDTTAFSPTCFMDNSNSNRYLWLTTNGVLKAGTVATVEDLAVVIENSDIVINNITNTEFTIEYTNPTEFFTYSNAVGHTDILLGTIEHAFDNGSLDVYPGGVGASVDGDVEITKYNIYLPESVLTFDSIAPMFSTNNVYTNGDFVIRNRHLYECTNYTGQAGWHANDWRQTTVTGILGNLRSILDAINGEAL